MSNLANATDPVVAIHADTGVTLSGRKQEAGLTIRKLLLDQPIEKVVNRDAMAKAGCLDGHLGFAPHLGARSNAN